LTDETPWSTAELLGRMDDGWSWVEARLAVMTDAQFDEPVRGGWTRRQMVQHLITWHRLTVDRLREFQRTGEVPRMARDEDEINAEAAATADGRTRDELAADFDASFRQLREEVERLGDDQLTQHDAWPGGVVVGNTFGHYEEHRPDIEGVAAEG
jgi:hypothetical protein